MTETNFPWYQRKMELDPPAWWTEAILEAVVLNFGHLNLFRISDFEFRV